MNSQWCLSWQEDKNRRWESNKTKRMEMMTYVRDDGKLHRDPSS